MQRGSWELGRLWGHGPREQSLGAERYYLVSPERGRWSAEVIFLKWSQELTWPLADHR